MCIKTQQVIVRDTQCYERVYSTRLIYIYVFNVSYEEERNTTSEISISLQIMGIRNNVGGEARS